MPLKHKTLPAGTDRPGFAGVTPSLYAEEHLFSGGDHGSVLTRNTLNTDGAGWIATANGVLTSTGVGILPTFATTLPNVVQDNITRTGTLVSGATGAGFTVALTTSTITGTLADARLSANVPLLNAANAFSVAGQSIAASITNSSLKAGGLELQSFAVNNEWLASNLYYNAGFIYRANGFGNLLYFSGGDILFQTTPSGTAGSAVTPTTRMSLTNAGLLTTTATRSSGANVTALTLSDTVTGAQTVNFGVQIRGTSNGGNAVSAIGFETGGGGTNNETQLAFYTQNVGAGLTKHMTLSSLGLLTISGRLITGGDATAYTQTNANLLSGNNTESVGIVGSTIANLNFYHNGVVARKATIQTSLGGTNGGALSFHTKTDGGADVTLRWTIDASGHFVPNGGAANNIGDATNTIRALYVDDGNGLGLRFKQAYTGITTPTLGMVGPMGTTTPRWVKVSIQGDSIAYYLPVWAA